MPPIKLELLNNIGKTATDYGVSVYIVGGTVRDILLGRTPRDIDIVVEGDGIKLSHILASKMGGSVLSVSRFLTSKLRIKGNAFDIVTARRESYPRPGALPIVSQGSLRDDLARRDFSINAMALRINAWGQEQIADPFGGQKDLEHSQIRILQETSFQDDATRIMRAIKYEKRLGMVLEKGTESSLISNLSMLDTIEGYRLRKELKLWFEEPLCSSILVRASDLGVIEALDNGLNQGVTFVRKESWLWDKKMETERFWLSLIAYFMNYDECSHFIARFGFRGGLAKIIWATNRLKCLADSLILTDKGDLQYQRYLDCYDHSILRIVALINRNNIVGETIDIYLSKTKS
ncbi:MAG: hypothetical protein FI729_06315 [SAR202 cluster bacterium]|nr:hypothetical protein [SAR202 cluster bacterium]|tara:strand:+ start:31937 stop:32980 length:1044 start_codon:yes stop_codon:yes gene_type:complete